MQLVKNIVNRLFSIMRIGKNRPNQIKQELHRSRYEHLIQVFCKHNPASMIEIGVWRGDRTVRFLSNGKRLQRYVGFDLFEGMTSDKFNEESMGACVPHSRAGVMERIEPYVKRCGCQVELISGPTEQTLPDFTKKNAGSFDLIFIDGGHSLETVANDWQCAKKLVAPGGLIVLDDYYLNDTSRGAKSLVDGLVNDSNYRVRFFPMVENIIEDLQITMVEVWPIT